MHRENMYRGLFPLVFCLCLGSAQAQQTIFNVPSADITDKGSVYLEHESQFRTWEPGRYWFGTDYFAVGLGYNTEVDVTLYNTSVPASGNVSAGVGFRSAFPLSAKTQKSAELKWTVGSQALISFEGRGAGYWAYSHLSGRLPKLNTRLTSGISAGTRQLFGENTVHFIGGVEQPLTKTLGLMADWYSGNHSAGYLTAGGSVSFHKGFTLFAGCQRPNTERVGRAGITLELAKIF
jgi:hypothetical protein